MSSRRLDIVELALIPRVAPLQADLDQRVGWEGGVRGYCELNFAAARLPALALTDFERSRRRSVVGNNAELQVISGGAAGAGFAAAGSAAPAPTALPMKYATTHAATYGTRRFLPYMAMPPIRRIAYQRPFPVELARATYSRRAAFSTRPSTRRRPRWRRSNGRPCRSTRTTPRRGRRGLPRQQSLDHARALSGFSLCPPAWRRR